MGSRERVVRRETHTIEYIEHEETPDEPQRQERKRINPFGFMNALSGVRLRSLELQLPDPPLLKSHRRGEEAQGEFEHREGYTALPRPRGR